MSTIDEVPPRLRYNKPIYVKPRRSRIIRMKSMANKEVLKDRIKDLEDENKNLQDSLKKANAEINVHKEYITKLLTATKGKGK